MGKKCHSIGFANDCNNIVNTFKATWDEAKKTAVNAANAAKKKAVDAANAAKDAAVRAAKAAVRAANRATAVANAAKAAVEAKFNELKEATTSWLDGIGEDIRCASTLTAPR